MLNICFIGLGSIGLRHLTNLTHVLKERKIAFKIDALRSKNTFLSLEYTKLISNIYYDKKELENNYDIIFVTNPTFLHYDTVLKIISKTKHLFIEKPLFEKLGYDIGNLKLNQTGVYYVACPLRYHPVIKYLKGIVNQLNVYSVRAISSSYLPTWRSGIDYRNVYSAKKNQGGGVSLDLIHEWDYIIYLFGFPEHVHNFNGKYSDLEIDSDDISIYIASYKDKLIEVHLDYIGRQSTRACEIYCKNYVIYIDFINYQVKFVGEKNECINFDKEDMYINELNYFLDMILDGAENINDLNHALKVLKIAIK